MFEQFTRNARLAVESAQQAAKDLGSDEIGAGHLLIGVLHTADHEFSSLVSGFGLTADEVRVAVSPSSGPDGLDDPRERAGRRDYLPFSRPAMRTLELALRESLARKGTEIGSEHLLLGILGSDDGTVADLIAEHVDPARLRDAVAAFLAPAP